MGQTCRCSTKLVEGSQISIISNIEPCAKSQVSGITTTEQLDTSIYNLMISQEFYLYRSFLQDYFNSTTNNSLRQKIQDITWDIQYYISTATNFFKYDIKCWILFIESDERQKIIESFGNLKFEPHECSGKQTSDQLNFDKWLRKNNFENQDSQLLRIHVLFFSQE